MAFLVIIFFCYFIVAIIRKTKVPNEWLPLISGCLGSVLGIIALYAMPSIVPEQSAATTLICGFFSGLAATGSNQVFKQAVKFIKEKYNIDIKIPTITPNNENKEK